MYSDHRVHLTGITVQVVSTQWACGRCLSALVTNILQIICILEINVLIFPSVVVDTKVHGAKIGAREVWFAYNQSVALA